MVHLEAGSKTTRLLTIGDCLVGQKTHYEIRYRKLLLRQIKLWKQMIERMRILEFEDEDKGLLNNFVSLCNGHKELSIAYCTALEFMASLMESEYNSIQPKANTQDDMKIIDIMGRLIDELLLSVNQGIVFKTRTINRQILASLHNLPRCFFASVDAPYKNIMVSHVEAINYSRSYLVKDFSEKMFGLPLDQQ